MRGRTKEKRFFYCPGYESNSCGKKVQITTNSRRRCPKCAKKFHQEQNKRYSFLHLKKSPMWWTAIVAKTLRTSFLKKLGFSADYNVRKVLGNKRISNKKLGLIAAGSGYPDFPKEALEEKGPGVDAIRPNQWARAVLEYRAGRAYKVCWRFDSLNRRMFNSVFDFCDWQIEQGKNKEKQNGRNREYPKQAEPATSYGDPWREGIDPEPGEVPTRPADPS